MSRPSAALSLPPGDRDEPPADVLPADAVAGRADEAAPAAAALPPGPFIVFDGERRTLDELVAAFAEVDHALSHAGLPAIEALAHRHAKLAQAFAGAVTAARRRRTAPAPATAQEG